jgi:hypothetical protein
VIWRLLITVIASSGYFLVRMYQYQYQAERKGWIRYIRAVSNHVQDRFHADITGDLSPLHRPISACLKIYSQAFADVNSADKQHLKRVISIEEQGISDDATVSDVQLDECSSSVSCLMGCARKAQDQMKLLLEPKTASSRFKAVEWNEGDSRQRPTEVPSAAYAVNCGVKDGAVVQWQLAQGHHGELNRFTNVARMKLVFEDCKSLLQGLEELQEVFEVKALLNCFANPTAVGFRTLYAVVKVRIGGETEGGAEGVAAEEDTQGGGEW